MALNRLHHQNIRAYCEVEIDVEIMILLLLGLWYYLLYSASRFEKLVGTLELITMPKMHYKLQKKEIRSGVGGEDK